MYTRQSKSTTNLDKMMDWHADALDSLRKDVPFFVRGAVKKRVEKMAVEAGCLEISLAFYRQAKDRMAPNK